MGATIYIFFSPFSLFVSVYVYASVCDFVCKALLLPFVLGFCLSIFLFYYLKIYFFLIIFILRTLFYFILFYLLLSFFLSFFFPPFAIFWKSLRRIGVSSSLNVCANGWGFVPVFLVVWHRVSCTVACWSLSRAGSWH